VIGVANSTSGTGVLGMAPATTGTTYGVVGRAMSVGGVGALGHAPNHRTGVVGVSSALDASLPAAPVKTGVYGHATQDADARGVHGKSTAGRGVYGQATSGSGVFGYATTGYALRGSGRLRFDRASGVATIAATGTSVVVTPEIDVTSASFVLLTPKGDQSDAGFGTRRTRRRTRSRSGVESTADLKVGWLLVG
jgi:hypothetical protein